MVLYVSKNTTFEPFPIISWHVVHLHWIDHAETYNTAGSLQRNEALCRLFRSHVSSQRLEHMISLTNLRADYSSDNHSSSFQRLQTMEGFNTVNRNV